MGKITHPSYRPCFLPTCLPSPPPHLSTALWFSPFAFVDVFVKWRNWSDHTPFQRPHPNGSKARMLVTLPRFVTARLRGHVPRDQAVHTQWWRCVGGGDSTTSMMMTLTTKGGVPQRPGHFVHDFLRGLSQKCLSSFRF